MTKYTATSDKAGQKSDASHRSGEIVGSSGITQIPPAYGIDLADSAPIQKIPAAKEPSAGPPAAPTNQKPNNTGLPDQIKTGIEALSGLAMDDVAVHYNSSKPGQLQARAYTQGTNIYVGPGQNRHLPHEAWHVVQQKQGRVKPTMQLKGKVDINYDADLEQEADVMGERAKKERYSAAKFVKQNRDRPIVQKPAIQGIFKDWMFPKQKKDDLEEIEGLEEARRLYQHLDNFIERLNELIENSERERGENVRFIEIAELLSGTPAVIQQAFADFVAGKDPAEGTWVYRELAARLEEIFGFDRVKDLMEELGNPDWKSLEFLTIGLSYKYFKDVHSEIHEEMVAKYDNEENAEKYLPGVIKSGKDVPTSKAVTAGDKYYKLMGQGDDFIGSLSPYYLSLDELERAIQETDLIEHKLGLPIPSYRPVYFVYEITAEDNNVVFVSTIAPTVQNVKGKIVFRNTGGRKQTLIIDSNNTNKWRKNPTPVKIYDPVEPPKEKKKTPK